MHRTQCCAWRTCASVSLRYPPFDYSEWKTQRARISKENQSRLNAWIFQVFALKFQSRLKTSISLEIFNLAWKLQSRLKFSISTLRIPPPPTKIGVWRLARLKFSVSLENVICFNLAWKFQTRAQILIFFKIWALWESVQNCRYDLAL